MPRSTSQGKIAQIEFYGGRCHLVEHPSEIYPVSQQIAESSNGAFQLIADMHRRRGEGSVVTMICDPGDRYIDTYYSEAWLQERDYDIDPYISQLEHFFETGNWREIPSEKGTGG
jgi:cysteine synthase